MAVSSVKARLDVLERQVQPSVRLDLSALADADLEFIESVGAKCESQDGKPDWARLSVEELRRLNDLLEQCAHEPA